MSEMTEHIGCQELVELVTEYLERSLSPHEAALFEQHLNFCEGCVRYVGQLRTTLGAVGHLREDEVPDETRTQLLAVFRGWRRS